MNTKATRRRMRTRSRNAPAPKVSGWVSEANCKAAARPRADMGCAFDASGYAIYQVQVSGSVQLFALRRIYPSRHVAEKGSYAEPLVLWDSTSPGKRSPTRKCAVSAGIWEDVCKVYGIAECRFQGDPRESSKSINTRVWKTASISKNNSAPSARNWYISLITCQLWDSNGI